MRAIYALSASGGSSIHMLITTCAMGNMANRISSRQVSLSEERFITSVERNSSVANIIMYIAYHVKRLRGEL